MVRPIAVDHRFILGRLAAGRQLPAPPRACELLTEEVEPWQEASRLPGSSTATSDLRRRRCGLCLMAVSDLQRRRYEQLRRRLDVRQRRPKHLQFGRWQFTLPLPRCPRRVCGKVGGPLRHRATRGRPKRRTAAHKTLVTRSRVRYPNRRWASCNPMRMRDVDKPRNRRGACLPQTGFPLQVEVIQGLMQSKNTSHQLLYSLLLKHGLTQGEIQNPVRTSRHLMDSLPRDPKRSRSQRRSVQQRGPSRRPATLCQLWRRRSGISGCS